MTVIQCTQEETETETARPSVFACASVITGSHFEVCDVSSTEAEASRRGHRSKKNDLFLPSALPSPLPSSIRLRFRLCFIGSHWNVRILPSPLRLSSLL